MSRHSKALKEYKTRLNGLLQDKQVEIWDAQENLRNNDPYMKLKMEEKEALEYAINLIDREILEGNLQ